MCGLVNKLLPYHSAKRKIGRERQEKLRFPWSTETHSSAQLRSSYRAILRRKTRTSSMYWLLSRAINLIVAPSPAAAARSRARASALRHLAFQWFRSCSALRRSSVSACALHGAARGLSWAGLGDPNDSWTETGVHIAAFLGATLFFCANAVGGFYFHTVRGFRRETARSPALRAKNAIEAWHLYIL